MKSLISVAIMSVAFAGTAFAGGDHTCQGGHNCDTTPPSNPPQNQTQGQGQDQGQLQLQGQLQGQQQNAVGTGIGVGEGGNAKAYGGDSSSNSGVFGSGNSNTKIGVDTDVKNTSNNANTAFGGQGGSVKDSGNSSNLNSNVAVGGQGGTGGKGGNSDSSALALGGTAKGGNASQGQIGINKNGDMKSTNNNESSASTGASTSSTGPVSVQVGGEGAPLTASSQSVEGSSLAVDDHSSTTYRNKSVALALPGATADNGSTAQCLESRRGWAFVGMGASGRTRTNKECDADRTIRREFTQCFQLADAFAKLGLTDHAVAQLRKCGGVTVESEPFGADYVKSEDLDKYATKQDVNESVGRAFKATQHK